MRGRSQGRELRSSPGKKLYKGTVVRVSASYNSEVVGCRGGSGEAKKLLPVRTGLVAKSTTSPEMFRYSMACSRTCALLAVHAHC